MPTTARQFGHYELEDLIGVGGMGEVWRAKDLRRDRLVALKLLPENLGTDHEYLSRFRRESHVAARLREPHVIPIHDYGEIDGRLFIDMRLVDGRDLGAVLQEGPVAPERAILLMSQVADALEAAHSDGLVHRDVKPSNILVTPNDFVYVVDFGIARSIGSTRTSLTITGATVGTLDYMAPERFTNQPLDARVDVYSLACVLAECLTAARPFRGEDLPALLYAHLYADPPRPSELVSGIPPELDEVISRGMAKRPEDRYDSPCQLVAAARAAMRPTAAAVPTPFVASAPPTTTFVPAGAGGSGGPPITGGNGAPPLTGGGGAPPAPVPVPAEIGLRSGDGAHNSAEQLTAPRLPWGPGGNGDGTGAGDDDGAAPGGRRRRALVMSGLLVVLLIAGLLTWVLGKGDGTSGTGGGTAGGGTTSSSAPTATPSTAPPSASLATPTVEGAPIPVGEKPGYMAIAPNGRYAYIANRAAGVVTVFDIALGKTTSTIPIPDAPPQFITFAPDGKRAYITVTNADYTVNEVVFVDTSSNRPLKTVQVGKRPFAPETSPDGKLLYVPLHNEGRVQVLDTESAQQVASYPVAQNPHWITVSRDGSRGWTANHESGVVSVLDLQNGGTVLDQIPVGKSPHSIAFSPDGKRVAVVCYDSNDLWVMDATTHAVLRTVPIGLKPQDVTWAPDGAHLYTANVDGGTVSVVDTETYAVTATIPTGKSPTSVSVLSNGTRAYVTNLDDGTVVVLRTSAD